MSALEQDPFPLGERRRRPRQKVNGAIAVHVGRGAGVIFDLSEGGMRVRHSVAVPRGSLIRVSFVWQNERFSACAVVMTSRIASLGVDADEAAFYESRLRYSALPPASAEVLARVLEALQNQDLRRWVANLRGWPPEVRPATDLVSKRAFVRCRLVGPRLEKKWTRDPRQPENGLSLPANTDPRDVDGLGKTYQLVNEDGRQLIRLIAAVVIREDG